MLASLRSSGKIQAFLIHLGISASIVGALLLLMLTLWYPQPWFAQDGGWHVFRLILLVDVVLGPTLTLVVFRRGKRELGRDLTIIATIQAAALAYGAVLMFLYRPAFLVYAENNFFTVPWPDIKLATRDLARVELFAAARGPGTVMLRLPRDPAEQARIFAAARAGGGDGDRVVIAMGDFYQAMTPEFWQLILNRSANITAQAADNPDIKREFERFRAGNQQPLESLAFVPVVCRYGVIMLIFDRKTQALVDWLS
jgi:hypothetical protein